MRLVLDLETSSTADLRLTGAPAYAEHPDTRVTVLCYAIDDEPVETVTSLNPVPHRFAAAVRAGSVVVAHNYLFEWNVYHQKLVPLGWPPIPLEQWSCTMARAYVAGYPGSLEMAGKAAKIAIAKNTGARDLMLRMARPRTLEPLTWWHETSPDHFQRLCDYCVTDVEAERLLDRAVPELSARERAIFEVDHHINQRGLNIDLALVERLLVLAEEAKGLLTARLIRVTNGQITTPNQVARIREWLSYRNVRPEDLRRNTVKALLDDQGIQGEARTVLQARLDASRSSTAKLKAIRAARSPDGRLRGCFQYYGANRTGRWAGRRVQPQNLYRGSISDIPSALVSVMRDWTTPADLEALYEDSAMGVVASCLRGCIVARPGHKLVIVDLSQIEARVLAWLAGESASLACFRRGDDIYADTARRVGSSSRQLGKVLVLACIGQGTLVLTSAGWKPIQTVTIEDQIWDGLEWVTHEGLVERGQRETLDISGARLTPDHLVLCGANWLPALSVAQDASIRSLALVTASGSWSSPDLSPGNDTGCPPSWFSADAERQNISSCLTVSAEKAVCDVTSARAGSKSLRVKCIGVMRRLSRMTITVAVCLIDFLRALAGATIREIEASGTMAGAVLSSAKSGETTGRLSFATWSPSLGGTTLHSKWTDKTTTKATSQETFGSCPGLTTCSTGAKSANSRIVSPNLKQRLPTYDLANCGPRSRFTIWTTEGPLIVHNCGFGMGPEKFQATAAGYNVMLDAATCETMVQAWREANPAIVQFWWACERAMHQVCHASPGSTVDVRGVTFVRQKAAVLTRLPSGRHLVYRQPSIQWNPDNRRNQFTYMGSGGGGWSLQRAWPGKMVENIVQAVARDALADHMVELDRLGLPLVATVHDELIAEVPEHEADATYDAMRKAMQAPPAWAVDLPMDAAGFIASRYRKA